MGAMTSVMANSGDARLAGYAAAAQKVGLDKAFGNSTPTAKPAAAAPAPAAAAPGQSMLAGPKAQVTPVPDDIYRKKTLLGA